MSSLGAGAAGWAGTLEPDGVHVWHASLDQPEEAVADSAGLLSAEELARADRYRFARDRRRFVLARGFLRCLLGGYGGLHPAHVMLAASPSGKPQQAGSDLRFNLSHSHEAVVCAVARCEVGVDVEHVRPLPDADDLARRFFSSREVEALRRVERGRRLACFFTCWTRKEAYVKATGRGLAARLDGFSVSVDPDRPVLLCCEEGSPVGRWSLANLSVEPGYVGALAVEAAAPRVVERRWQDRD